MLKIHDGMTALMRSAKNGHISVVELLLQAGADVHLENKMVRTHWRYRKDPVLLSCYNLRFFTHNNNTN
jgi:ankyrin repeat protein